PPRAGTRVGRRRSAPRQIGMRWFAKPPIGEFGETSDSNSGEKTRIANAVWIEFRLCGSNGSAVFPQNSRIDHVIEWVTREPLLSTENGQSRNDGGRPVVRRLYHSLRRALATAADFEWTCSLS